MKSRANPGMFRCTPASGRAAPLRGTPDPFCPAPSTASFFVSTVGTRLRYAVISATFQRLTCEARPRAALAALSTTLHSLRHSFAVQALIDAYATRGRPRPAAATGHISGACRTERGLLVPDSHPELTALVGSRLERDFEKDREARS